MGRAADGLTVLGLTSMGRGKGTAGPNRIRRGASDSAFLSNRSPVTRLFRIVLLQEHPLMAIGTNTFLSRAPDLEVCGSFAEPAQAVQEMPEPLPDLAVYELNVIGPYDLSFLQRLRRVFPELPILVYSFHEEVFFAHRAFQAGANGFLMKHEPPEHLTSAIDAIRRGKRYRSDRLIEMTPPFPSGRQFPDRSRIHNLSNREIQVLQCLGEEYAEDFISHQLGIRPSTVRFHTRAIVKKFGLRNKAELVECARHWVYFESQFV